MRTILAVADTDASGNYLKAWRVPLVTYGKNTNQAEALIGDAVAGVVEYARKLANPSSSRSWTSARRSQLWRDESRRYSRMLSSVCSYGKIKAYFISRGYRQGVEVISGQPGVQFDSRPGEVHGAVRADGTPGCGPWCWPVACSAVRSASRVGGFAPAAIAFRSPSPYP